MEQIAAEKAGHLQWRPAVAYDEPPSVAAVLRQAAERTGDAAGICGFFKAGAGVGQPGGPALPLRGPGVRHPPAGRAPDEKRRDGYLCRAGAGPV